MGDRVRAIPVTICFVRAGERWLLLRTAKNRPRFAGLWNGLGGHVQPREDIRACARREIREESGLDPERLELRGVMHESGLLGVAHLAFVFSAEVAATYGEAPPREGPEGTLTWFRSEEIPFDEAVPDLRKILPRLLASREIFFGLQEFDGSDHPIRLCLS